MPTLEIVIERIDEQMKHNNVLIAKFRKDKNELKDPNSKVSFKRAIFTLQHTNKTLKNLLK